nr:hypothetical protein [Tanacetum cinerariifolium]
MGNFQTQEEGKEIKEEEGIKAFWFKERKYDDNAAVKEVNAADPIVFNDGQVTMTMAQTLIKIKDEKARILDEQMAKRLHDEEVEQAIAREKQEQDDFKRAQELQQQKYQSLKRKPISVAQARKNMIVYLKNMARYKMAHFNGMTYDQVRPIFEREYNKVQTFLKPDRDKEPTKKRVAKETLLQESFKKLRAEVKVSVQTFLKPDRDEEPTKKRVAEKTLLQESFKKLRAEVEVSGSHSTQDTLTHNPKEMFEEDVKNMLEIVLVSEFKVEALQVKYPLIDWEIHSEGSRSYWKIIRVGGITEAYQSFEDMLKGFDREDLDALWRLRFGDENLHGGQSTKEQEFGYILQVIKKLELKKLDGLVAGVDDVQRLQENALRDYCYWLKY